MNLVRLYINKNKYTNQNDYFDFKLIIFYNLYSRASISNEVKVKAYLTILSKLALNHYYTNLKNIAQNLPFD